jgi:hypothetical protein
VPSSASRPKRLAGGVRSAQTLGVTFHVPQSLTSVVIAASSKATQTLLAAEGFRRKSVHLLRASSDVLHCVHFQSSKWGTAQDGQFTVNFVVTWPSIYEAWTGKPLPANAATAAYPIQNRIGSCLPERTDVWWTVNDQTDAEAVAQKVASTVAETAPSFFARFSTTAMVLACLREHGGLPGLTQAQACLVHAFLAKSFGCESEAEQTLAVALANAGSSPFKSTIRSFAQRADIALHR